jgi:hypothetical protein
LPYSALVDGHRNSQQLLSLLELESDESPFRLFIASFQKLVQIHWVCTIMCRQKYGADSTRSVPQIVEQIELIISLSERQMVKPKLNNPLFETGIKKVQGNQLD